MAVSAASKTRARLGVAALLALAGSAGLGATPARGQQAAPADASESPRMPGIPFEELARRAQEEWDGGPSHAAAALRFYRAGTELDPRWADGWWHIGLVHFNLGRYADARGALARLVALVPDSGPGWSLLGTCDYRLGSYDLALSELLNGRSLGVSLEDDLGRESARSLTFLLVRSGQFRPAAKEFARLLRGHEDDPELLTACGLYGLRMKRLPDEVSDSEKDLVERVGRATAAALASRPEEAESLFQDVLARYPRTRGVHLLHGRFLMMEASPGASEAFRQEATLFPDNADALVEVALDALDGGRATDGLEPAKKAVALAPEAVWSHYALGRVLAATGATSEGIAELERADRLKPEDPDVLLALAQAHARAGHAEDVERVRARLQVVPAHRDAYLVR
jgi:predicted Zn-dependent protease